VAQVARDSARGLDDRRRHLSLTAAPQEPLARAGNAIRSDRLRTAVEDRCVASPASPSTASSRSIA